MNRYTRLLLSHIFVYSLRLKPEISENSIEVRGTERSGAERSIMHNFSIIHTCIYAHVFCFGRIRAYLLSRDRHESSEIREMIHDQMSQKAARWNRRDSQLPSFLSVCVSAKQKNERRKNISRGYQGRALRDSKGINVEGVRLGEIYIGSPKLDPFGIRIASREASLYHSVEKALTPQIHFCVEQSVAIVI